MRNLLAVILAFFVSTAAWASRGRPVSNLRFEGHLSLGNGFVASDGKDFLFLSSGIGSRTSVSSNPQVYVQRVVGGTPAGPSLGIGAGTAAGIAWTGIDYLVVGSSTSGLWTAHVSRQGTLIPGSTRLVNAHQGGLFASNAQSALAVFRIDNATLLVQPLDLTGQTSGPAVPLNVPRAGDLTIGPSANGYAIVSTGLTATLVRLVRSDGSPLSATPIAVQAPSNATDYYTHSPVVATDGTDTLILFAAKYSYGTDLNTAIIGPDGTVKRPGRTVFTDHDEGGRSLQPSAVWTGSEYAIAIRISEDPISSFTKADVGLLRINRSGDLIREVAYTTSGEAHKEPTGLGWNGSQFLVPWSVYSVVEDFDSYCVAVPLATMTPTPPAVLGRSLTAQIGLKIAASNGQYLAAWIDSAAAVTTVRASRIDNVGNFLDGEGIALGTAVPPVDYSYSPNIAIDSDGTNWLVVWADGKVRGRRLSRAGALLGAQPIPITTGYDVAVRWNGVNYVVVAGHDSLSSAAMSSDGVVTSSQTLMTSSYEVESSGSITTTYTSPSLVVVLGETIATYENVVTFCGFQNCSSDATIVGWRLNSAANPVGAAVSLARNVWPTQVLATDGTHLLLVWEAYDAAVSTGSIFGTVLSAAELQEKAPFRIASQARLGDVAFDGSDFLVALASATSPYAFPYPVGILRVTPAGAVQETAMLPLDNGESAAKLTFAASPGMPALIGYVDVHPDYDNRARNALLFSNEFAPSALAVPSPPSVTGVLKIDQNTIDVRWQPAVGALGTSAELQLEDGTYRPIGVASANASSGRFSLAGLPGSAIRLRAWNTAGLSEPSASVAFPLPRQRAARPR